MSFGRKARDAFRSAVAAWFLVSGLGGAFCAVSVCTEDCDPCLSQCKCNTNCDHGSSDSLTSHRLVSYRLSMFEQPDGGLLRTISDISGLSLDRADGPRDHEAADFRRFAEGVLEVNGLVLQPRRGTWSFRSVDVFEEALVVGFAREGRPGSSLDFLFDRRGNLVEIDETRDVSR
jgi:hypothetical protein